MKKLLFILLLQVVIYPTIPGTNIKDRTKPGYVIKDSNIYHTIPGTKMRDWTRPGFKVEGDSYDTSTPTQSRSKSKSTTRGIFLGD